MAKLLLQWILHRPGDENGYMWCPRARLDTENELPRAKPIPLEQYFQRPESSRRRAIGAKGGNPQKDLAKKKSHFFFSKKIFFLQKKNPSKYE